TDAVIGGLGHFTLSEKWRATLAADYGGFSSSRETYQITVTFDYAFADNWSARFGYRHLNIDNRSEDFRAELSGPVIGVSYRF
ncbi:MAG: outer membrane protein, partial [Arenibacterium sp.]